MEHRKKPRQTRAEANRARSVRMDEQELRRLLQEARLCHHEMAARLGVSTATLTRRMRQWGLKSLKGRGSPMEKNHSWRGGRSLDADGYVRVKSPGHPHATKAGYVLEHRLVMEKAMGRYLRSHEVVHHKDGNKQNNDRRNLELFQSNADHLRYELTGRTPNFSPEGLQRMREASRATKRRRAAIHPASESGGGP